MKKYKSYDFTLILLQMLFNVALLEWKNIFTFHLTKIRSSGNSKHYYNYCARKYTKIPKCTSAF